MAAESDSPSPAEPDSKPGRLTREIDPLPEGRKLPRSGCMVFLALGLVLAGLTLWGAYSLYRQDQAIAKFTSEESRPVPVAPVLDQAQADELANQFRAFAEGRSRRLELTVEQLNQAIATFGALESYRGLLAFSSTDPSRSTITADASLTLNQPRFWRGQRYLNGWIEFTPQATASGLQLFARDVTVPDRNVDPGFVESFGQLNWLAGFLDQETAQSKSVIENVRRVEIQADKIVLLADESMPGPTAR